MLWRLGVLYRTIPKLTIPPSINSNVVRYAVTNKHGVVLQEPHRTSFGVFKIFVTVTSGLLIGAAISKNIANFLEENDLFVPSDDDDDDD
ncbi:essential MCU regulator, mitochondrial [Diabrotica virgifera virgifera]|uniref:Essential MCU regulator, mitochondrial n=1 Tax=Diabrotica virgifera virgifera TaxID=50390 RepID=A0A6P7FAW5_DIAVI|nr:essential MCU regulator, mitochondrial [Diabrotica virgifera virgifera]